MLNSDKVEIYCNGILFNEFNDFALNKSIENFCGSFSFTITQSTADKVKIRQGADIVIYIANELVFTGLVEAIEHNQAFNQHNLTISGRDKTAELIDSYILPKQYKQNDFIKLMRIVLDDNGYKNIRIESDIKTLPKLLGKSFVAEKDQKIFVKTAAVEKKIKELTADRKRAVVPYNKETDPKKKEILKQVLIKLTNQIKGYEANLVKLRDMEEEYIQQMSADAELDVSALD